MTIIAPAANLKSGALPSRAAHDPDDIAEEQERLRGDRESAPRTALCLSGGGIRSATFSLGVIQALAKLKWLDKFTYLSTVSGGGYIGSWLTSWIRRDGLQPVLAALAGGSGGRQAPQIQRLRSSSNYLSPVTGISGDALALVSTFLRNLLVNWAVLIPLFMAVTLLPMINVGVTAYMAQLGTAAQVPRIVLLIFAAALAIVALAYTTSDLPQGTAHQTKRERFTLFVLAPILFGCYLISVALVDMVMAKEGQYDSWYAKQGVWTYIAAGALIHLVGVVIGYFLVRSRRQTFLPIYRPGPGSSWHEAGRMGLHVGLVLAAGAVTGWAIHGGVELARALRGMLVAGGYGYLWPAAYSTIAVPFLLACFFLGSVAYIALMRRRTDEGTREWWARSGGVWIRYAVLWLLLHVLCVWIPAALSKLGFALYATGGVGAVGGALVAAFGYFSKRSPGMASGRAGFLEALNIRVLDLLAAAFVVALFAIVALIVARNFATPVAGTTHPMLAFFLALNQIPIGKAAWLIGAIAISVVLAKVAGANAFSMHAMYGNRLVRAYLGATRDPGPRSSETGRERAPHAYTGFDPDDDVAMADAADKPLAPLFHVVNTALNIVRPTADRLEWQERKAASFTITPLRTGSQLTGYCRTSEIGGHGATGLGGSPANVPGLTLGRAMTISGAAAAPNMGYHTSRLVAFVMTFFNIRLGWWLPNPARFAAGAESSDEAAILQGSEPRSPIGCLLSELLGNSTSTTESIYLSDGGHFDNLGLYEMARRKCTEIVVVDAGQDSRFDFDDLERAIRIIRNDLNADIRFDGGLPTAQTMAADGKHFAIGTITYGDVSPPLTGEILYIKPGLDGREPLDVLRYAQRCREGGESFPHQSTADQFFDEPQFESYRALGLHSLSRLFGQDVASIAEFKAAWRRLDDFIPVDEFDAAVPETTATKITDVIGDLVSADKLPAILALAGAAAAAPVLITDDPPPISAKVLSTWTVAFEPNSVLQLPLFAEGKRCAVAQQTVRQEDASGQRVVVRQAEPCDDGTHINAGGIALLRKLDEELVKCAANPAAPLRFTLRGYASTSEYRSINTRARATPMTTPSPEEEQLRNRLGSHKRNLLLADDRAETVDKLLEGAQRANSSQEKVAFWLPRIDRGDYRDDQQEIVSTRYQEMYLRLYQDSGTPHDAARAKQAAYDRGAGAMNRRVDLEFQSMGVCTIDGLQRALQNAATLVTNGAEDSSPKNRQTQAGAINETRS